MKKLIPLTVVTACAVFSSVAADVKPAQVDARKEVAALAKEVGSLVKQKKGAEALAAAEKAVKLALENTARETWLPKQTAYEALGTAYSALGDRAKTVDAFCKASENHNPHFGSRFHRLGFDAVVAAMRDGKTDEARGYLKRIRALDKLEGRDIANAIDVEGRCCKVDKNWKGLLAAYAQGWSDTNLCASVGAAWFIDKCLASYKESQGGYTAVWEVLDKALADPAKFGFTDEKGREQLVKLYAGRAWKSLDYERMKDARRRLEAIGISPEDVGMFGSVLRYNDMLADFPKSEEELNIPTDAAKFLGFDPAKKVVHAKDFGWNPTNATACLQKALEADATTVVIDAMPSPWYIWNVKLTAEKSSNRRIVFAKGCTVLTAPEHNRKKEPGWYRYNMFDLEKCTNVWIEGEGELGKDVYVGKYRNRAERLKWNWNYGGTGFQGAGCKRVVLKNLWVSNCGQDALCWGGYDSYVIDCLFDNNYRQGMSLGGSSRCVYKNVTFCNTFGGEPHCGIDFEPYYEIYLCAYQYFFDCKFYNNASKNVIFATSTYAPMTALFKRCQFEAQRNGNIAISARLGIYLEALHHATSNIIFDECRIDGYSDGHANPIQIGPTMLYDVTFKNCEINDRGRFYRDGDHRCSPIALSLDRAVWDGYYPCPGIVTFDNVKINGYRDVPLIEVKDYNGKLCVNSFRGKVNHNGKEVDLSTFDYQPSDRLYGESPDVDVAKLHPAEGRGNSGEPAFALGFAHNWYNPLPRYRTFLSGRKGAKAVVRVADRDTPDGRDVEVAFDADGVREVDFNMAPDQRNPDRPVDGFTIKSVKGASIAYQAEKQGGLGRVVQIDLGLDFPPYTGYFEVPAKKLCAIKLQRGGILIRDGSGKTVVEKKSTDYSGSTCLTFTPDENEIWSFTMLDGRLNMKMFAPLSGVWADDPAFLPTVGEDLAFFRVKRTGSAEVEMRTAKLLPLPVKPEIAKAIEEGAAKRAAWGATNDVVKAYRKTHYHYEWMEPAMQDKASLALMDAEKASTEPLRKLADMQKAAGRESGDLRRYVAFVELYAPALIGGTVPSAPSPTGAVPDEDALESLNDFLAPYGLEVLEDGHLYYEDYMSVVKIVPYVIEKL